MVEREKDEKATKHFFLRCPDNGPRYNFSSSSKEKALLEFEMKFGVRRDFESVGRKSKFGSCKLCV